MLHNSWASGWQGNAGGWDPSLRSGWQATLVIILPAATDNANIKIITRRVRELMQETLRVLTVATQIVFLVKNFGDGYIAKRMTCHPERSEGTQRLTQLVLTLSHGGCESLCKQLPLKRTDAHSSDLASLFVFSKTFFIFASTNCKTTPSAVLRKGNRMISNE